MLLITLSHLLNDYSVSMTINITESKNHTLTCLEKHSTVSAVSVVSVTAVGSLEILMVHKEDNNERSKR